MENQVEYLCKVCNKQIHPKRVALGYKTSCVEHSDTVKFSGYIVTEGREGEETCSIEVIRDPKLAEQLAKLNSSNQSLDLY